MWYPPLGAQITFPVERKPLLVLINNGCFACRQLLPETKRKYVLILRKLSWLVQGKSTWSTSFLAPPLLTPPPPPSPQHKRRETNDNKNKNSEVLEEGHFSIRVIVTT